MVFLNYFPLGLFLENACGDLKACALDGLRIDFFFHFGETDYFLLQGFIEGAIGVVGYFMVLNRLSDSKGFLLNFLQPLVDFDEGFVLLSLANAVLAVIVVV